MTPAGMEVWSHSLTCVSNRQSDSNYFEAILHCGAAIVINTLMQISNHPPTSIGQGELGHRPDWLTA